MGALAVRFYLLFHTYILSKDGIIYIDMARKFALGDSQSALSYDFHPLYPLFIAFSQKIFGDWVLSSQIVSSFLGALTILPLYYLGKRVFGPKAAAAGALLYVFSSYAAKFSADSLSEATYLFFFVSAMAAALAAIESNLAWQYAAAGALSSLAYLTRPEGIGLLVVISVWTLLPFGRKFLALRRFASIMVVIFAFLALSSPYLHYLGSANGALTLTKKKSIWVLIGLNNLVSKPTGLAEGKKEGEGGLESVQAAGDPLRDSLSLRAAKNESLKGRDQQRPIRAIFGYIFLVLGKFVETLNPFLFLLFIFGLFFRKWISRSCKGELFLASAFFLYFPLFVRLLQTYSYTSRRYYVPLVVLALLWCGAALAQAHEILLNRIKKYELKMASLHAIALFAALGVLPVLALAPFTFTPLRAHKMADKEVALWIKKNGPMGAAIMSGDPRIAFYAGGVHVSLPEANKDRAMERLVGSVKLNYLVIDIGNGPGPEPNERLKHLDGDLRLVYVSGALRNDGRTRLAVYQLMR